MFDFDKYEKLVNFSFDLSRNFELSLKLLDLENKSGKIGKKYSKM